MNLIFIGAPFFRSLSTGWINYYQNSSGPKFTEEQIRLSDQAAQILDECHPITNFLSFHRHLGIYQSLDKNQFHEDT